MSTELQLLRARFAAHDIRTTHTQTTPLLPSPSPLLPPPSTNTQTPPYRRCDQAGSSSHAAIQRVIQHRNRSKDLCAHMRQLEQPLACPQHLGQTVAGRSSRNAASAASSSPNPAPRQSRIEYSVDTGASLMSHCHRPWTSLTGSLIIRHPVTVTVQWSSHSHDVSVSHSVVTVVTATAAVSVTVDTGPQTQQRGKK